jgi:Ca-activated chloride channel family protein
MGATDLEPTRMAAAVAAATDFVRKQPASVIVGVVAFSDSGIAVQQPTSDQDAVIAALDRLSPQRGTSLARGIDASLAAIDRAASGPIIDFYTNSSPEPTPSRTPVPPGTNAPAVIVLLTDGENTLGPDPIESADTAADRGVRIYTAAQTSTSTASRSTPGSTPRRCGPSPTAPAGATTARPTPRRSTRSTARSTRPSWFGPRTSS